MSAHRSWGRITITSDRKPWSVLFMTIYETLTNFRLDTFGMEWPEVDRRYV